MRSTQSRVVFLYKYWEGLIKSFPASTLPSRASAPLFALREFYPKKVMTNLSLFSNPIHPQLHLPTPPRHRFFFSSWYVLLQNVPTQNSRPNPATPHPSTSQKKLPHLSLFFAPFSLPLRIAASISLFSPPFPRPLLILYLHCLTHPAHCEQILALSLSAIAVHVFIQFCSSCLSYLDSSF